MMVVFRVDASVSMGTGHVIRCLTLATLLQQRGAQTHFICRELQGNLIELIRQQGIQATVLPPPESTTYRDGEIDNLAELLDASQKEDAHQCTVALKALRPDFLIVDHYGLDAQWEHQLRPFVSQLMVIDDFTNRRHDCDLLLNQNYIGTNGPANTYESLLSEDCRVLSGPRYALLRPEYVSYRQPLRNHDGGIESILVYFGGPDPHNLTGLTLRALNMSAFNNLRVDVVIGASNPHTEDLVNLAKNRPGITLHGLQPGLAELLAHTDLAIGAGGATTWERMCLGVPSYVVCIADNQRKISEALGRDDLIVYAGNWNVLDADEMGHALAELVKDRDLIAEMALKGQLLVDGFGALRVAEVLEATAPTQLQLRPARRKDVVHYFNWANDPTVRTQAVKSAPIAWHDHQAWYAEKLSNPLSRLYLLEAGSLPVGQIRFDLIHGDAVIDYSIDIAVRGRGWGTQLVALGEDSLRTEWNCCFYADVKRDNQASCAVFRSLGYRIASSSAGSEFISFRKNLS